MLPAEQRVQAVAAAGQRPHGRQDGLVGDRDRPALALLGDVVEHQAVPRHPHVPLLQRRRAVVMVQLGVLLAADAEQAEVDQPDGAGDDAVPVEVAALQVLQGGRPQRGERAGEPQHVGELLGVSLLSPELVVAVLGPAPAVHAGGLDVSQRVRRDPDVRPGGRDGQRADARQRLGVRNIRARRIAVPETLSGLDPRDARTSQITAHQPRNRGRRYVQAHDNTAYKALRAAPSPACLKCGPPRPRLLARRPRWERARRGQAAPW